MSSKCHINVIKLVFRPIMVVNNPYKHNLTINQSIQRILPVINVSQEVQKSCKILVLNFDGIKTKPNFTLMTYQLFQYSFSGRKQQLAYRCWPQFSSNQSKMLEIFQKDHLFDQFSHLVTDSHLCSRPNQHHYHHQVFVSMDFLSQF